MLALYARSRSGSTARSKPPADLAAPAGEKIEFEPENESKAVHNVELPGPDGSELGEAEAHGDQDAGFVAGLPGAGDARVRVFLEGQED